MERASSDSLVPGPLRDRRAGYTVSIPFGIPARHDCVVEGPRPERALRKVQIETGFDHEGAVRRECRSRTWRRDASIDYRDDVDLFAVWVPERRALYFVPVTECGRLRGSSRLTRARNGQEQGVRYADRYLVKH